MKNIELFVAKLAESGINLPVSKYTENYYDVQEPFYCSSLSSDEQTPIYLRTIVSSSKIYLALSGDLKIILRPIDRQVAWEDMTEESINQLAQEYINIYEVLKQKAQNLMASF